MLFALVALTLSAQPASLDLLRDEAAAVVRIQQTLDWYTRTVGETSIKAETYKGHERLFSPESIALVGKALKNPKLTPDERRALQFLKSYLAVEHIGQSTARFDDEVQNAEVKATVKLSWLATPVPYKEIENLSKDEKDAGRRGEIEKARAEVWRDVLNPILARKEQEAQKIAKRLGYASYVALSEESRLVDLKALLAEGHRFLVATDELFKPLLAEVAQKELGLTLDKLRRSDLPRLRNAPRYEKYFPKELMQPSFLFFLEGIGLDMKTVAGTDIRVDDAPHPLKEPRAACYNIHVPDDVRITVKPTSGVADFATFFHEGGHALHFSNTTTKVWEFQQLGSNALTEGFSELFGKVWADPIWLKRYRDFVGKYNTAKKTNHPLMTDQEIVELSRTRVYNDFYFLRRYGSAKLIYEAVLHGGDPAIWKGSYDKPVTDLMQVYKDAFAEAYGIPLGEEDALRFRTDVDDTFYAADYARAFALANLMSEALRAQHGGKTGDWYTDKTVGPRLKKLFADGQKLQPDEVAKEFGEEKLTFKASEDRARRLLAK
jgi:hypothetical protein